MEKRWIYLLLLIIIAGVLFNVSNEGLRGYLRSETGLAKEVKSPLDSIDQYKIASQAPFKYRLLFPSIIKGSYQAVYDEPYSMGFYHTYKFWSLFFYISSVCTMFWLLLTCGFNESRSFLGSVIFVLLPPMLMAFTLPVHTREDTLAYTLFFTGLVFLLNKNRIAFLIVCLLGALTRETLLLLPLLYFFFAKDTNLIRRFLIAGLPGLLWISIRFVLGQEKYDVWEGLKWNLANPEQVAGFLFITFNVCWVPFLIHLLFYKRSALEAPEKISFFYRTSAFALSIILITTFVGGIYNEIRLLYLFSPWMIIIFIDFLRNYETSFHAIARQKSYWAFAGAALAVCSTLMYFFLKYQDKIIVPGKYNVPYKQWIVFSVIYIFILLLILPPSWKIYSLKKSVK